MIKLKQINSVKHIRYKLYASDQKIDQKSVIEVDNLLSFFNDEILSSDRFEITDRMGAPTLKLVNVKKSQLLEPTDLLKCYLIAQRNDLTEKKSLKQVGFLFESIPFLNAGMTKPVQLFHLNSDAKIDRNNHQNINDCLLGHSEPKNQFVQTITDYIDKTFQIDHSNSDELICKDLFGMNGLLVLKYSKNLETIQNLSTLISKAMLLNQKETGTEIQSIVIYNYALGQCRTYRLSDPVFADMIRCFHYCISGHKLPLSIITNEDLSRKQLIKKIENLEKN